MAYMQTGNLGNKGPLLVHSAGRWLPITNRLLMALCFMWLDYVDSQADSYYETLPPTIKLYYRYSVNSPVERQLFKEVI